MGFVAPILGRASHPLGVVALFVDPADYLYPLLRRWPTSSPSGETKLVRRDGNEVVFLNELGSRRVPP